VERSHRPTSRHTIVFLVLATQALIVVFLSLVTPELALYGTTQQEDVVANAPQRYEKIPSSAQSTSGAIYIERTNPRLRVSDKDIESVVIEERRTAVTETGQRLVGEPYYAVTFSLNAGAAKALRDFIGRTHEQRFGLRFDGNTLGVVRPFGPFEGNEFTYYTHSLRSELERAFAPIKPKLVWR
jgi:hypothetical protein